MFHFEIFVSWSKGILHILYITFVDTIWWVFWGCDICNWENMFKWNIEFANQGLPSPTYCSVNDRSSRCTMTKSCQTINMRLNQWVLLQNQVLSVFIHIYVGNFLSYFRNCLYLGYLLYVYIYYPPWHSEEKLCQQNRLRAQPPTKKCCLKMNQPPYY